MAKAEKTTYYLTGFYGAFFNRFIKHLRVNKKIQIIQVLNEYIS